MDRDGDQIDPFKNLESDAREQHRKCQYQCGDTKSFKIQSLHYSTDVCPDKYAELVSTGMLVCTGLTQTVITSSETFQLFQKTFDIPILKLGMYEYQCEYDECKRVFFINPDENSECPSTYIFYDETCTNAGDALIDNDKMYIELLY